MAVGLVAGTLFLTVSPALSDPPPSPSVDIDTPGTVEPPGYEDFRDAAPSPQEIEEQQERRDDRNIVSPGMRDDQELQREMGQD
ncbi:MAG: hypothetical protein C0519_00250 [Hyphomicrobium sp.]|jgi:hypothetical protein|nr:hypothetical protein [Hyphomicrobium sp.]PPD08074.1 MAG: hypothetical protein CTY28_07310 [Hyphomicrobium sp.]